MERRERLLLGESSSFAPVVSLPHLCSVASALPDARMAALVRAAKVHNGENRVSFLRNKQHLS